MEKYIKSESGIYYMNCANGGSVGVVCYGNYASITKYSAATAQECVKTYSPCTRDEFEEAYKTAINLISNGVRLSLTDEEFVELNWSDNWEFETETEKGQIGDNYYVEHIPDSISVTRLIVDGIDYTDRLTDAQWQRVQEIYEAKFGE